MSVQDCPKCGYQQAGGDECPRCGIVFARYRAGGPVARTAARPEPAVRRTGVLRRLFRIARWGSLAVSVVTLVMILVPSAPPRIAVPPDAPVRAEAKVQEFRSSVARGRASMLEMDESELNGWLGANLALEHRPADPGTASGPAPETMLPAGKAPGAPPSGGAGAPGFCARRQNRTAR